MNVYRKAHNDVFSGLYVSNIHHKYRVYEEKRFRQFIGIFNILKQHGKSTGLDFGCGVGTGSYVGKIMNMHVTGLDIPNSIYQTVHAKLDQMGYDIVLRDTRKIPWTEFEDDQFDFILAQFSLSRGIKTPEQHHRRIRELARVAKPGAIWFVLPKRHGEGLAKNTVFIELAIKKHYKVYHKGLVKAVTEFNQ